MDSRITASVRVAESNRRPRTTAAAPLDTQRVRDIIEAAVRCFSRWGITRTRVDDIAIEASIPRSQIYRHFASKDAIVLAVIVESIRQHNTALRAQVPLSGGAGDIIVDSMVSIIRHAIENRYTAALHADSESPQFTARALVTSPEVRGALREYWEPVFDYARGRNELRPGIDLAAATHWVVFIQFSYLALPELIPDSDDALADVLRVHCLPGLIIDS
jgi:AcrR family transcriptional regulator